MKYEMTGKQHQFFGPILTTDIGSCSQWQIQSKLFITSLFITEYSLSDINLQGTDLFPLKFLFYNIEYSLNNTDSMFWEQIYIFF